MLNQQVLKKALILCLLGMLAVTVNTEAQNTNFNPMNVLPFWKGVDVNGGQGLLLNDSQIIWERLFDRWGDADLGFTVAQTNGAGYYVVAGITDTSFSEHHCWVIRTNSLGQIADENIFGPINYQSILGLDLPIVYAGEPTNDGGYYTAWTCSTGILNKNDFHLLKMDSNLNEVWEESYNHLGNDFLTDAHQTSDGGYILCGFTYIVPAPASARLVKANSNGSQDWGENYNEGLYFLGMSCQQASDGGYILLGNAAEIVVDTTNTIVLIKTNSRGVVQWRRHYDEDYFGGIPGGVRVINADDGGYIIVGGIVYPDSACVLLMKTDSQGYMEWYQTFCDVDLGVGTSVSLTDDNGYILAAENIYDLDTWVLKTDANGDLEWDLTFGGDGLDAVVDICQNSDGDFVTAGLSNSYSDNVDVWLVKFEPPHYDMSIVNALKILYEGSIDDSTGVAFAIRNNGNMTDSNGFIVSGDCDGSPWAISGSYGPIDPGAIQIAFVDTIPKCWYACYHDTIDVNVSSSGADTNLVDNGFKLENIRPCTCDIIDSYDDGTLSDDLGWHWLGEGKYVACEYEAFQYGTLCAADIGLVKPADYGAGPMYVLVFTDSDHNGVPDDEIYRGAYWFRDVPEDTCALYHVPLCVPVEAGESYWIATGQKQVTDNSSDYRTYVCLDDSTDDMRSKWEYDGFSWSQNNRYEGDTYIRACFDYECCCDVRMIPDNYPVRVPRGGSFGVTGIVCNICDYPVTSDVWVGVIRLNPYTYYEQLVFQDIPLGVAQCRDGHFRQGVPVIAPSGTYYYAAWCGDHESWTACDSFAFAFTVTQGLSTGGMTDWTAYGDFGDFDGSNDIPREYALDQNCPNPFNAVTTISYDLPATGHVRLDIYNLTGQMVETLTDGGMEAGHHTVQWDASQYSSGVYFYRLAAGEKVFTRRMTLLK